MNKKQHVGFAARLREVQGNRSQRRFASDVGVYQQNVNRYLNGTTPHTSFILTLNLVENIAPSWLLLGKGPKKTK